MIIVITLVKIAWDGNADGNSEGKYELSVSVSQVICTRYLKENMPVL